MESREKSGSYQGREEGGGGITHPCNMNTSLRPAWPHCPLVYTQPAGISKCLCHNEAGNISLPRSLLKLIRSPQTLTQKKPLSTLAEALQWSGRLTGSAPEHALLVLHSAVALGWPLQPFNISCPKKADLWRQSSGFWTLKTEWGVSLGFKHSPASGTALHSSELPAL